MVKTAEMARLEADLEASEELRARLQEAVQRIADSGEVSSDGEGLAKVAAELAAVAGGNVINGEGLPIFDGDLDQDGREAWCVAYWHCYTALIHTEGGTTDEKCLKNYACFLAYH